MQKTLSASILLLSMCGFCMIHEVVSKTVHVEPTPVEEPLILTPKLLKTGIKRRSTWNLIAPLGSRLKMHCEFYVNSCEQVNVEYSVLGNPKYNLCPTNNFTIVTTTNVLNISVTNNWHKPGVMCKIFVTKPYIHQPEIIIDSSEYGKENKVRRKPSCRCGWTNKGRKRIVGGHEVDINEYPFMVILYDKIKKYYFCDGSIITNRHVLSAAHCTFGLRAADVAVNVGEHDTSKADETSVTLIHDVERIINHPNYDKPTTLDNDVAILFLKQAIIFNQYVGPVCMPKKLVSLTGQLVKIMGYGLMRKGGQKDLHTTKPLEANLKVIDYSVCELAFNHSEIYRPINNSQICTYAPGKGLCQGDSGGPVVHLYRKTNMLQQVGIISFVGPCASIEPSSSVNVAYYLDWIKEQITATGPGQLCF